MPSSAANGQVSPASLRVHTATNAPGFLGVTRAVRTRHTSEPMTQIPDSYSPFCSSRCGAPGSPYWSPTMSKNLARAVNCIVQQYREARPNHSRFWFQFRSVSRSTIEIMTDPTPRARTVVTVWLDGGPRDGDSMDVSLPLPPTITTNDNAVYVQLGPEVNVSGEPLSSWRYLWDPVSEVET